MDISASGRTIIGPVSRGANFLAVTGTLSQTLDFDFSKDGTTWAPLTTDAEGTQLSVTEATTRVIITGQGFVSVIASGADSGANVSLEKVDSI